jgi:hypothetical protein
MSEHILDRINKKLQEENRENRGEEGSSNSRFTLMGGSIPAAPPEMGMAAPNAYMGRLGAKAKSDYGDFGIAGTGVSMDTPQGKINKLAALEANYEKDGFSAGITKPIGGRGSPRVQVGFKMPFKKGGKVSSASKRADGCCVKGKTKGKIV